MISAMTGNPPLSLEICSLQHINHCLQFCNIWNMKTTAYPSQIIQELDNLHYHKTRSATSNNLFIPRGDTQSFQKTMSYSGSRLWNEISAEIKRAQTLDTFQAASSGTAGTSNINISLVCAVWPIFIFSTFPFNCILFINLRSLVIRYLRSFI